MLRCALKDVRELAIIARSSFPAQAEQSARESVIVAMMKRRKSSDAVFGLLALLSVGFVAAIVLKPSSVRIAARPAEGAVGNGSRAGPLANQISIRGDTVAADLFRPSGFKTLADLAIVFTG